MTLAVDPSDVKPGENAPVPTDRDALLIECLRTINRMGGLFNEIAAWLHRAADDDAGYNAMQADLSDMLVRRFSDCSGVHVFIAANNLGVELPPDLDGSTREEDYEC